MLFFTLFMVFQAAPASGQRFHSGEVAVPGHRAAVAAEVRRSMDLLETEAQTPTEGIGFEAGLAFFIEQGASSSNVLELAVISKANGCEEECLITALHGAAVLSETGTLPSEAVAMVGASIANVAATFTEWDAAGNAFMLRVELGPLLAESMD